VITHLTTVPGWAALAAYITLTWSLTRLALHGLIAPYRSRRTR
jgi:hypothetical protein